MDINLYLVESGVPTCSDLGLLPSRNEEHVDSDL